MTMWPKKNKKKKTSQQNCKLNINVENCIDVAMFKSKFSKRTQCNK